MQRLSLDESLAMALKLLAARDEQRLHREQFEQEPGRFRAAAGAADRAGRGRRHG